MVPPYGSAIHQAVASGNVEEMQKTLTSAQQWLSEWGDLRSAVEALKVEIAKLERKRS